MAAAEMFSSMSTSCGGAASRRLPRASASASSLARAAAARKPSAFAYCEHLALILPLRMNDLAAARPLVTLWRQSGVGRGEAVSVERYRSEQRAAPRDA